MIIQHVYVCNSALPQDSRFIDWSSRTVNWLTSPVAQRGRAARDGSNEPSHATGPRTTGLSLHLRCAAHWPKQTDTQPSCLLHLTLPGRTTGAAGPVPTQVLPVRTTTGTCAQSQNAWDLSSQPTLQPSLPPSSQPTLQLSLRRSLRSRPQ